MKFSFKTKKINQNSSEIFIQVQKGNSLERKVGGGEKPSIIIQFWLHFVFVFSIGIRPTGPSNLIWKSIMILSGFNLFPIEIAERSNHSLPS
jgi:hypothetical protein